MDPLCAYVTLTLDNQLCGLPALAVRDVLAGQTVAPIPLAPHAVAGNLNLRGRIVTAIDLRRRLGLPAQPAGTSQIAVVTEHGSELYALMVDQVHEVVTLPNAALEPNPPTLLPVWDTQSRGVHRVGERLMMVLEVDMLLTLETEIAG